jgi:hypothetical protein
VHMFACVHVCVCVCACVRVRVRVCACVSTEHDDPQPTHHALTSVMCASTLCVFFTTVVLMFLARLA